MSARAACRARKGTESVGRGGGPRGDRAGGPVDRGGARRLLEVGEADLREGLRLFERYEGLGAFDAVLAASTLARGPATLVSADRAYGAVRGLRFVELAGLDVSALD